MPDRWSYDAATGEFVRYSVSRDKWSLTVRAQSPHADKREAWDVVTDGDVARTLRVADVATPLGQRLEFLYRELLAARPPQCLLPADLPASWA
jgi:hypothetical protein